MRIKKKYINLFNLRLNFNIYGTVITCIRDSSFHLLYSLTGPRTSLILTGKTASPKPFLFLFLFFFSHIISIYRSTFQSLYILPHFLVVTSNNCISIQVTEAMSMPDTRKRCPLSLSISHQCSNKINGHS